MLSPAALGREPAQLHAVHSSRAVRPGQPGGRLGGGAAAAFTLATLAGGAPTALIYAGLDSGLGASLGSEQSLHQALESPRLLLPLAGLTVLALAPTLVKRLRARSQQRLARAEAWRPWRAYAAQHGGRRWSAPRPTPSAWAMNVRLKATLAQAPAQPRGRRSEVHLPLRVLVQLTSVRLRGGVKTKNDRLTGECS